MLTGSRHLPSTSCWENKMCHERRFPRAENTGNGPRALAFCISLNVPSANPAEQRLPLLLSAPGSVPARHSTHRPPHAHVSPCAGRLDRPEDRAGGLAIAGTGTLLPEPGPGTGEQTGPLDCQCPGRPVYGDNSPASASPEKPPATE